jgi:hypothetical protein
MVIGVLILRSVPEPPLWAELDPDAVADPEPAFVPPAGGAP